MTEKRLRKSETEKKRLNKTNLEKLKAPKSGRRMVWDTNIQGFGVRVLPTGKKTLFYQARLHDEVIRLTIGHFSGNAADARQAEAKAKEYASQVARGVDPRPKKKETETTTLGDVLSAYCDLLDSKGKKSAVNVRNAVHKHIRDSNQKLWHKAANDVSMDELVALIGRIYDNGQPRGADLVRSYLKSAYRAALNARGKPNVPQSMRSLRVKNNPARDIEKVEGSGNARDRALTLNEIRSYWRHVQELPEPRRSVLIIHLLTGAQRLEQLQRATLADLDGDTQTITLWDYKGRRTHPRRHVVPVLPTVQDAIDRITGSGPYIMSANGGKSAFHKRFMANAVNAVLGKMEQDGTLEKGRFTPGSIRATVETQLAGKPYNVNTNHLAHLLSHGMGDVQNKHYQMHLFIDEKREALEKLERMAKGEPEPVAEVIDMRARA